MDDRAKNSQFDYEQNSNLVIQRDGGAPRDNEPSGEPDTLASIYPYKKEKKLYKFGDKVYREKPTNSKKDEKMTIEQEKGKNKYTVINPKKKTKIPMTKNQNILEVDIGEDLIYRPRTKETQLIYEELLTLIQSYLPDQSQNTLKGALDELLAIIKTENIRESEKVRKKCNDVLGVKEGISSEDFNKFYQMSNNLVDYGATIDDKLNKANEDDIEVPVELDENAEEDEASDYEREGNIDEDEEEDKDKIIKSGNNEEDENEFVEYNEENILEDQEEEHINFINKIDGFWLRRSLEKMVDESVVVETENKILALLSSSDRECENKLVFMLSQSNLDFIKTLLKNKWEIYYCVLRGKAQSEEEQSEIENIMKSHVEGLRVYEKIQKSKILKNKEKEFTRNVLKQAHQLKKKTKENVIISEDEKPNRITDEIVHKINRNIIDLDSLVFSGAHFMSNKKCQLPKGSYVVTKKGYEEVHVPCQKTKELGPDEKIISKNDLKDWMQDAFPTLKEFNRIQSKVLEQALYTDENLLICAPTGAGKTNIALLTILRVVSKFRSNNGFIDFKKFKIVYIAPMKALVKETVGNFNYRLKKFEINVKELSGDVNLSKKEFEETHVIVSTPEKWDIITRKTGEKSFTDLVKLIIIDEIHLLHDLRGPVIESIVARTIRRTEKDEEYEGNNENLKSNNKSVRLVALSATLPNYEDVANFLRVKKKGLFFFDNSYRPVPLEQQYIGINEKKSVKKMLLMNEITYEKVIERAGKHQMIIFVHSRRETGRTAKGIRDMAIEKDQLRFLDKDSPSKEILLSESNVNEITNLDLRDLLPYGIGIHHAGLNRYERSLVEELFSGGHIQLLVSTATLAWGVNLPAHTVIIKGTQVYDPEKGKWVELSHQDILQMIGRAGRIDYDSSGEGIIITSHHELQFYLSLLNQQLPIESQMISCLADNINAEIVLGTISNIKDAVNWIAYSYLYIRMLKNPTLYGISLDEYEKDQYLVQRRVDLCHTAANLLDKHGLIKYDKKTGIFQITQLGRVASHYYIKYNSMNIYNEHLKPTMGLIDLFRLFSLSYEFKLIPIREEEKQELGKLMVKVPIPIKGSIDEPASKINVLLQAFISQFKLDGFALASDMIYVSQSAGRIFRALFEICLRRGWSQLTLILLNVCKMIDHRMWSTMTPLRQFKGIQEDILFRIEGKEHLTWERFYDMTPQQIGELIKNAKLGKEIHKLIHQFPRLELEAYVQPITRSCLQVELTITPDFQWNEKIHGTSEMFWIIVEDCDSEIILHYEQFLLKKKYCTEDHIVSFIVPMIEPMPPQYFIKVISDKWISSETQLPISFKHLILPEKFPPHTNLLDLQPLQFTSLKWKEAESLYSSYPCLNPFQTQVFKVIYDTDESVFIGVPTGMGKTLCAEFALLRFIKENQFRAPAVYVTSIEELAREKFREWTEKFSEALDIKIGFLTGQLSLDTKIFEKSQLIICTPDKLDMLTRRWRQRKNVQAISLVIIDEIHLLGESGSVLEVVISRLRFMSHQLTKKIRFIALSTSLANSKDLADWLGVSSNHTFNFDTNVRPIQLEIHIQGFEHIQRKMRLLAMSKNIYISIKTHASNKKPVMIYTSDRKQARITALDLLTNTASDDEPNRFLIADVKDIESFLDNIEETTLKHCLRYGVGYIHDGLSRYEKTIVQQLFKEGAIQVLILTHNVCWEVNLFCHLVMIIDPQKYDGKEHRWMDFSIPDMLQIMGRASLSPTSYPGNSRKCILFCQNSKKEYYKKFLYEAFPVESHLNHFLHDHLNAEIVAGTIENKQDCIDWLTWTFMYRRLLQNPNYYNLQGKSNIHLNDYLSELIDETLVDLEKSNCVSLAENSITALNFGRIAVFYYVKYSTIDLFSQSLNENRKIKNLIDILCSAYEFEDVAIRKGEEELLRMLAEDDITYKFEDKSKKLNEPHSKANILLQLYLNRKRIPQDLIKDQKQIIEISQRLILAMVDVISSNGFLKPAILSMELSQMIVQAMWITQNPLYQLPHFNINLVEQCVNLYINDITDLMNMDDNDRLRLLKFNNEEVSEIANVCNRYPAIEMKYNVITSDILHGEQVELNVNLVRDIETDILSPVHSMFFPIEKEEAWWLVVGDSKNNKLLSIKRFTFVKNINVNLKFVAPEVGRHSYNIYLLCDSWIGCDMEEKFEINVNANV